MKIVVCIRQGLDGQINPFDACAYESALCIDGADITLLSMGPASVEAFLLNLTRLGAKEAVLLSDKAFAGADTLATAYTLCKAIKKINPDLIFCGRQTLVGDTAQTGPMLAALAGYNLITNAMQIESVNKKITCVTRDDGRVSVDLPALVTIERINTLRLPRLRSKLGSVKMWNAQDLSAEPEKCGLTGSPTRVISTFENQSGKRKCTFITPDMLEDTVKTALQKNNNKTDAVHSGARLDRVFAVGDAPIEYAKTVSDDVTVLDIEDDIENIIKNQNPSAVIWGSDTRSKRLAATVAAKMSLGLCADCTRLETDGEKLIMYRPALSGSIIAKIESRTRPAMATVRTGKTTDDVIVCAGYGAKDALDKVKKLADKLGAQLAASRKSVDNDILPYEMQVGLTGKSVAPPVYIAIGVSGAVHHIAGMERSGTVIAINPDKDAPIFDYADFGIVSKIDDILK